MTESQEATAILYTSIPSSTAVSWSISYQKRKVWDVITSALLSFLCRIVSFHWIIVQHYRSEMREEAQSNPGISRMQVGFTSLTLTKAGGERIKTAGKKILLAKQVSRTCFLPIAQILLMHPEKLVVRICICIFDMFHMFIMNLM